MTAPDPVDPDTVTDGKSLPERHPTPRPEIAGQVIPQTVSTNPGSLNVGESNTLALPSSGTGSESAPTVTPSGGQANTVPIPTTVRDILNDPVTKHMGTAAPLLRVGDTVAQTLELIRSSPDVGRVIYFYVVDEECRLVGVVAARKLLLSQPETRISEIMISTTIAIPKTATVLEACEFFTLHKLLAFPVIDSDRKVLGVVNVDVYTEEILEIDRRQDSDDLFQLIGVHLSEAAQTNARLAFLGRFPWLLCNVAGGMLSALIADAYQDVSTLAIVAPFIALVTALAESVSIQSVSLSLQSLHAQPPEWRSFSHKVARELLIGLLLGAACGITVAIIAWMWKGSFVVAASLLLGITGGVVASAGVGLAVPYLLKLCRRDPQLASGPIALALSDVVTLLFYFNLGRWILG